MKILIVQITSFGVIILLATWISYFISRANYKKYFPKLDELSRDAWATSLRRLVTLGTITAAFLLIAGIALYLGGRGGGSVAPLQLGILFPITLIEITAFLGIGAYAFMTYKLHEHQVNGNKLYAKDVAVMRIQVVGLFLLFLAIQSFYLIMRFLH